MWVCLKDVYLNDSFEDIEITLILGSINYNFDR